MKYNQYKCRSKIFIYPGMAGWHFASIPQDVSNDIGNILAIGNGVGVLCLWFQLLVKQAGKHLSSQIKNLVAIFSHSKLMFEKRRNTS